MSMTRKDYNALAGALSRGRARQIGSLPPGLLETLVPWHKAQYEILVREIAHEITIGYTNFDEGRFLVACGIEP